MHMYIWIFDEQLLNFQTKKLFTLAFFLKGLEIKYSMWPVIFYYIVNDFIQGHRIVGAN